MADSITEREFEFPRKVDYPVGLVFDQKNPDGTIKAKWIITEVVSRRKIKAKVLEQ